MSSSNGEETPLINRLGGLEGRSQTHDTTLACTSHHTRIGGILLGLFLLYGYVLYATPSRAVPFGASSVSPTLQPSLRPESYLTHAPTSAPIRRHDAAAHRSSDLVFTHSPTVHPSESPHDRERPSVPRARRMPCRNTESFQESAARLVYPTFSQLNFEVRATIELLKNVLGTYSFAYFPLSSGNISYATWSVTGMDLPLAPPAPVASMVTTSDPLEVLIYYIDSIFTAVGDLSDSQTGNDEIKIARMQELVLALTTAWNNTVLSADIVPGLTWSSYLMYPGPYSRVWPGDHIVSWAISSSFIDKNTALYLEQGNRMTDDQLWGDKKPDQGISGTGGIETLIRVQVKETIKRYRALQALDPSGSGNWATIDILSTQNGILTYHKVRKVLRMIGITIDAFPDVFSVFFDEIPLSVVEFANKNYNASIYDQSLIAYGDMFCFLLNGQAMSFSTGGYVCKNPIVSIGTMVFANISEFDANYFGVDQADLDSLRMILMIKAFRLGELNVLPNTTACPSHEYQVIPHGNNSLPLLKEAPGYKEGWVEPKLAPNGYSIIGTICDIDDYFGDIHDLLVKYQQNPGLSQQQKYMDFTLKVAQGLQLFLDTINLPHSLSVNLLNGFCGIGKER